MFSLSSISALVYESWYPEDEIIQRNYVNDIECLVCLRILLAVMVMTKSTEKYFILMRNADM